MFGVYLNPTELGAVRLGDAVKVWLTLTLTLILTLTLTLNPNPNP